MAAIDFPAAPTDGQLFLAPNGVAYQWKAAQSLWMPQSSSAGAATPTFDYVAGKQAAVVGPGAVGSIMTVTQGNQILSRTFQANNPSSPIQVEVDALFGAGAAAVWGCVGLFIDGATNAVAQNIAYIDTNQAARAGHILWEGVLAAGPHTFSVRYGSVGGGGCYLGGNDGGPFAGNCASMAIQELAVGVRGPPGPAGPGQLTLQAVQVLQTSPLLLANTQVLADVPGMSVTINPTSINSRFKVDVNLGLLSYGAGYGAGFALLRNGAQFNQGAASGTKPRFNFVATPTPNSSDHGNPAAYSTIDSPATAAAITYKLQYAVQVGGGSLGFNRSVNFTDGTDPYQGVAASSIIVTEYAQ